MDRLPHVPVKRQGQHRIYLTPTKMPSNATLASPRSIPHSPLAQSLYQSSPVSQSQYLSRDDADPNAEVNVMDEFVTYCPSVIPYSAEAVHDAARETFAHTGCKPDFIFRNPGTEHITVHVGNNEAGDLVYRPWDDTHGYWVSEDEEVHRIVKYFEQEKQYRACSGDPSSPYERTPIAWPMKVYEKSGAAGVTMPVKGVPRKPSVHGLRERKKTQLAPYTADKIKHNRQKAGKKIEHDGFEEPVTIHDNTKRKSVGNGSFEGTRKSSRLSSDRSVSGGASGEQSADEVTKSTLMEDKLAATILYIKRESERVPTPLSPNCTLEELFDKIDLTWGLAGQAFHVIVTFTWKQKFGEMVLRRTLQDGWQTLKDNIKRAPCWEKGEACEIEALIQTIT